MKIPPNEYNHLWNDLPTEERLRLWPHMAESQLLHIWQVKQKAITAHKAHMADLDEWMGNIEHELSVHKRNSLQ
jgi:hypothetical protein